MLTCGSSSVIINIMYINLRSPKENNGITSKYFSIKIKNKYYHTIGRVPNSNRKIVERDKINKPNANTGMNTYLPWYRHFNKKWQGLTRFICPNLPSP